MRTDLPSLVQPPGAAAPAARGFGRRALGALRGGLGLAMGALVAVCLASTACGGDGGGGGSGGSGGASGVEPCASAQDYINSPICASDFPERFPLDLVNCAGDDKLCANCIHYLEPTASTCLLEADCKDECYRIRT